MYLELKLMNINIREVCYKKLYRILKTAELLINVV